MNKILISVLSTTFACLIIFFAYTKYNSSIHAIGEVQNIKWQCNTYTKHVSIMCNPMMVGKMTTVICNPQTNYNLVNTNSGDSINYQCIDNGNNVFRINYYVWFKVYDYKIVNYQTNSREEIVKINNKQKLLLHMNDSFEVKSIE